MNPDWKIIKYFKPHEFDDVHGINKGENISMDIVRELDFLRDWIGHSIIITAGFDSKGHSDNSYHYKGLAVDIIILSPFSLKEQWKYIRGTKFQGIGLYPNWHYHGIKRGGWHLDLRVDPQIWRLNEKNEYIYWLT